MFSVFNKGIGKATQFAQSHIFPAMKADFRAAQAGWKGVSRGTTQSYINNSFGPGVMGGAIEAGNIARRGFRGAMRSYGPAGPSNMAKARWAGYGIGGMWGLSGD